MVNKTLPRWARYVLFAAIAAGISLLPMFAIASELRSFSETGHELSTAWSWGTLPAFVESVQRAQNAWSDDTAMISFSIVALNLGAWLGVSYVLYWIVNRVVIRLRSSELNDDLL